MSCAVSTSTEPPGDFPPLATLVSAEPGAAIPLEGLFEETPLVAAALLLVAIGNWGVLGGGEPLVIELVFVRPAVMAIPKYQNKE